jgi:hypothetical protein
LPYLHVLYPFIPTSPPCFLIVSLCCFTCSLRYVWSTNSIRSNPILPLQFYCWQFYWTSIQATIKHMLCYLLNLVKRCIKYESLAGRVTVMLTCYFRYSLSHYQASGTTLASLCQCSLINNKNNLGNGFSRSRVLIHKFSVQTRTENLPDRTSQSTRAVSDRVKIRRIRFRSKK